MILNSHTLPPAVYFSHAFLSLTYSIRVSDLPRKVLLVISSLDVAYFSLSFPRDYGESYGLVPDILGNF